MDLQSQPSDTYSSQAMAPSSNQVSTGWVRIFIRILGDINPRIARTRKTAIQSGWSRAGNGFCEIIKTRIHDRPSGSKFLRCERLPLQLLMYWQAYDASTETAPSPTTS